MRGEIREFLKGVESEYNVRILYACESGSRAWGFASPDSDYDTRFTYVSNDMTSGSPEAERATIEIPTENDLDAGGWSVKKALSLLKKSNGALIEWLHSPYRLLC
jgi:predicted nucleotidyltransferase